MRKIVRKKGIAASNEWYSNQQLFEMVREIGKEMADTKSELKQTQADIKQHRKDMSKYNNIHEKLDSVCTIVDRHLSEGVGKNQLGEGIVKYSGYILSLILFVLAVIAYLN